MNWQLPAILFGAIFSENLLFSRYLGLCSATSMTRRTDLALGMGLSVTAVLTVAAPCAHLLDATVLDPIGLSSARTVIFVMLIAGVVQFTEKILYEKFPNLYSEMGIYLPLISVNCAILGGILLTANPAGTVAINAATAFAAGFGWTIAILLLAHLREAIDESAVPECMRGLPITLFLTALASLPFSGFSGMKPELSAFQPKNNLMKSITLQGFAELCIVIFMILFLFSLLAARKSRKIIISIEGANPIPCESGETLLNIFESNEIYLPSACGGKGSCGLCKVRFISAPPLSGPMEKLHFSEKETSMGMRLACLARPGENCMVKIPDSVLTTDSNIGIILENRSVASETSLLKIGFPKTATWSNHDCRKKGPLFITVELPQLRPRTRRAYSVLHVSKQNGVTIISIVVKKVALGLLSGYLSDLKPGASIKFFGPFLEFNSIPSFSDNRMNIMISGGTGIVPLAALMLSLSESLKQRTALFMGFRNPDQFPEIDEIHSLLRERSENSQLYQSLTHISFEQCFQDRKLSELKSSLPGIQISTGSSITDALQDNFPDLDKLEAPGFAFAAGPPEMVAKARTQFREKNWPSENILCSDYGERISNV
ncbi:MAG: hypothetical protein CVV64_00030 [Candidatus Wallbacteria bacterium HGW-Wallbacteria-1]|jgi:electron transport complex protein RnfA|uniref:2Fe-2S ferredoxin-type domain-containing protein n=1 Tax=Candidatus Wallbacteria bacterium HGW-Wallbacteria-1 TaxID=2013854 RepID=A0A2N1PU90_9BACT|nr:MAG: hypothetical protein CVV64_00030 [Candidatus Wallbacteria bacterium HGW-Wallbacteria-1]